jgi:hypothetical protein
LPGRLPPGAKEPGAAGSQTVGAPTSESEAVRPGAAGSQAAVSQAAQSQTPGSQALLGRRCGRDGSGTSGDPAGLRSWRTGESGGWGPPHPVTVRASRARFQHPPGARDVVRFLPRRPNSARSEPGWPTPPTCGIPVGIDSNMAPHFSRSSPRASRHFTVKGDLKSWGSWWKTGENPVLVENFATRMGDFWGTRQRLPTVTRRT